MLRRFGYIIRLSLRNLRMNRFTAISVTVLLTVSMVLVMLSFSYLRYRNAAAAQRTAPLIYDSIEVKFSNAQYMPQIYENMVAALAPELEWHTLEYYSSTLTLYTKSGYASSHFLLVDSNTYPQRLMVSEREQDIIRQKLQQGYAVLSGRMAKELNITANDTLLYCAGEAFPVYIAKQLATGILLDINQLPRIQGSPTTTCIYLKPAAHITKEALISAAERQAWTAVQATGSDPLSITVQPAQDYLVWTVEKTQATQRFYTAISMGTLLLGVMILFSSIQNKVQQEQRDTAIKLAVGAGWGGLFLQQFFETLACALMAALIATGLVALLIDKVMNPIFRLQFFILDAYAIGWAAALCLAASLTVALAALGRMWRLRPQRLLRGDAS